MTATSQKAYRRLLQENRRLQRELITDDLTGLFNARYLREQLACQISERLREGETPAILFIDIDYFKDVNENHGHEAAGQVLSQVGCKLASLVRAGDLAFRYGGDEFVVLVSGGLAGARRVGERIRQEIERQRFKVKGLAGPAIVRITVSVGLRAMAAGDRVEQVLLEADRAMFEAKRKSRNRLVISEKPL